MKSRGFIHVVDWYNYTFCKLAGVDLSDSGPGKFPVDSLDVWPIIWRASPHDHMMLGFNYTYSKTSTEVGAIIMGDYKLIIGKQGVNCDVNMWSPLDYLCILMGQWVKTVTHIVCLIISKILENMTISLTRRRIF